MSKGKLRISTDDRSAAFVFEKCDEANYCFAQLLRMLMGYLDGEPDSVEADGHEAEEQKADIAEADGYEAEVSTAEQAAGIAETETREQAEVEEAYPVKGFLYIECPNCGTVRGTCFKRPSSTYYCQDCGESFELSGLRDLRLRCECGADWSYKTNLKLPMFDIECIGCGNPVAVGWNERTGRYENI